MVTDIAMVGNKYESGEIKRNKKNEKKLSQLMGLVSDASGDQRLWLKIFWKWKAGQQDRNMAVKVHVHLEIKEKKNTIWKKKPKKN